ncbi:MAG TPA: hypothetical protein VFJ24_05385 [Gaiellales bacterium]|nr:hypothetical protein [Gaiellales bacterium]
MSGTTAVMKRLLVAAVTVAACAGWGHSAEASTYITTELGNAGPSNWAILGLGGVNVNMTNDVLSGPGQTVGNVGVASSGSISLNSSTPPAIIGDLYLGNTVTWSGGAGQVSGSIFTSQDALLGTSGPAGNTNPALASGAVQNALQAYQDFNVLTVDQTISGNITSSMTLSCNAAQLIDNTCVVAVTGSIQLGSSDILTLSGTTSDESFILTVAGGITLNGGSNFSGGQIRLAGTLNSPDDAAIVTNKVATGDTVTAGGGSSNPCDATSQANLGAALSALLCPDPTSTNTLPNAFVQGVLLSPEGGINLSPGMVIGEIIGGGNEIKLAKGSQAIQVAAAAPPTAVPAPASLVLLAAALVGVGAVRRGLGLA